MPDVNGEAAWKTLQTFDPLDMYGYCLHYVWEAYAAHGATSAASYPTAYSAWQAAKHRHTDMNPPPGKPIYLGRRHSDGNMDGDVFIAGPNASDAAATDYTTWGGVGTLSIQARMNQTGREYLGWSDDFLSNNIVSSGGGGGEDDEVKVNSFTKKFELDTKGTQTVRDGESEFLRVVDDPVNTKIATGPNLHLTAVLSIVFDSLPLTEGTESVQVEPMISARAKDGSLTDSSLGRQEIIATPGLTRAKIPIECHLENDDHYLRVRVYVPAGIGDVVIDSATVRGAEFTS